MPLVLQLTKRLTARPAAASAGDFHLRHYAGTDDIEAWLAVRQRAFARQKVGIGNWDAADFQREFLDKPWWRPEAMWLAETRPPAQPGSVVGTVTLARRGMGPKARPVVHWLCVVPGCRRRGLGRLLMDTLEAAVWDEGRRQVWLETHSAWGEALALYRALGYVETEP